MSLLLWLFFLLMVASQLGYEDQPKDWRYWLLTGAGVLVGILIVVILVAATLYALWLVLDLLLVMLGVPNPLA